MRDTKYIFIFLLFVFNVVAFNVSAQVDTMLVKRSSPKQLKKLGKSAFQQNDPGDAVIFFEAYLKRNKTPDPTVLYMLAKAYYELGDYESAQVMFLKAYDSHNEKTSEALFYYAEMQKSNGKYDSAKINFQKFKKEYKGKESQLKRQAAKEIIFCDSVQKLVGTEKKIIVTHLDSTINKINTEAGPANIDENTLVFASLRTDKIEYVNEDDTAHSVNRKLYYAKKTGDTWKFEGEYGDNLNMPGFNTGNACFSPDRKRIYFTRCKQNYKAEMICAIYVSEKNGDHWTEPVKLPKNINNPKYTSTMPAVTLDQ